MRFRAWWLPAAIIAAFLVADYARDLLALTAWFPGLYDRFPYWLPGGLVSSVQIAWSILVVVVLHRRGVGWALRELGCRQPVLGGVVFALIATGPLWLTFVLTMPLADDFDLPAVLYLSAISPLAEEIVYRALAFGQLRRLAAWPFWPAALVPSVLFGWGHLDGGEGLSQAIGIVAITGFGSLLFCWLYERWEYNLWVPFFLHVSMNLAWNTFNVGDSAFAGWLPTVLQVATMVVAVVLTLQRDRFRRA